MRVLGIDLETTSLDIDKTEIVELGMCLWDVGRKMPLVVYDKIVKSVEKPHPISGLLVSDQEEFGVTKDNVISDFVELITKADYVVAHNGNAFDIPILDRVFKECRRKDIPSLTKPLLDTRTDLPIPLETQSRSLRNLLTDHEILNYFPHRAVGDVLCMLKLLSRYDITTVIERSRLPTKRVVAIVTYAEKDLAKERGFHWDGDRKIWFTDMKECDYKSDSYPFETRLRDSK